MKKEILLVVLLITASTSFGADSTSNIDAKAVAAQQKYDRLQSMSLDELVSEIRSKPTALGVINRLRRMGDKRAVPDLKAAFDKAAMKNEKQIIAAALVALGEDGPYWDYIADFAKSAVNSD
ncbi:MAG: hypothetical protein ACHQ51_14645, partial [Elusimicrobiota bacterium]